MNDYANLIRLISLQMFERLRNVAFRANIDECESVFIRYIRYKLFIFCFMNNRYTSKTSSTIGLDITNLKHIHMFFNYNIIYDIDKFSLNRYSLKYK